MNKAASVIISNTTRGFDKQYTYLVPENMENEIKPGMRAIVPFGSANRNVEGYIADISICDETSSLKEIKMLLDSEPVLNKGMLKLCGFMKKRYLCTYSDAIKCMLPPGIGVKSNRIVRLIKQEGVKKPTEQKIIELLIEAGNECEFEELKSRTQSKNFNKLISAMTESGYVDIFEEYISRVKEKYVRVAYLKAPEDETIEDIETGRIKKIQQIRILEMLLENEFISVADIVRFAGVSASVLDTLKKHGYIDYKDIEVSRDPYRHIEFTKTYPLSPTPEQKSVLEELNGKLESGSFHEALLHGVTGSGKTEVYMQLIRRCLDAGKNAIVLVPEISLTPQMVERFKGRFGDEVAVLHSRLSLGERYDQWRLILEGGIKVVVGARSAVFAPFDNLGIIIIDEEHENTYKSEITPKYHARDIARERCIYDNCVLLLGSATPSVETYYRAQKGEIGLLKMLDRANMASMPKAEIVDMRCELEEGNRTIFSRKLAGEIEKNIHLGQQTILFLNRRGYSSFVLCRGCGYVLKCANCNISMTYHARDERLICHYCGYTVKNPSKCPKCGSDHIRHFGVGTQRVEDDTKKQFDGCSAIRMDMDTTSYKNSHEQILKAFREENINILIGTQMIAKGHDFPNVTLVGVLAADSLLNTDDYRATERTFQLLTQVAGRAGRGKLPGRVIVQTYNTEDFSILTACRHDYESFYSQEIILREKLEYPPFTNIANIILYGANDRFTFSKAKDISNSIREALPIEEGISIMGPSRSPLSKIKNNYRWRIIIKCRNLERLISATEIISDSFYKRKDKSGIGLSIDINPVNML
ncbi:MAG TPA: primosomal protein N' [Clostridia bacterium]|nr:primosomal protein N' [Clostridia bacterium]